MLTPREAYKEYITETRKLYSGDPFDVTVDFCNNGLLLSYNDHVRYKMILKEDVFYVFDLEEIVYTGRYHRDEKFYNRLPDEELQVIHALLEVGEEYFFPR